MSQSTEAARWVADDTCAAQHGGGIVIAGIPVSVSEHAVLAWVEHHVVRHPIKKRRRQWTVKRVEKREPAALIVNGMLVVHPTVAAAMGRAEVVAHERRPRARGYSAFTWSPSA